MQKYIRTTLTETQVVADPFPRCSKKLIIHDLVIQTYLEPNKWSNMSKIQNFIWAKLNMSSSKRLFKNHFCNRWVPCRHLGNRMFSRRIQSYSAAYILTQRLGWIPHIVRKVGANCEPGTFVIITLFNSIISTTKPHSKVAENPVAPNELVSPAAKRFRCYFFQKGAIAESTCICVKK